MNTGNELTVFEHLEELRKRVMISLAATFLGTIVGYLFSGPLLKMLLTPIEPDLGSVYFFSPAEAFIVKLKVAMSAGLFLASPVILNQIWRFISPAFHKQEKRALSIVTVISSVLFLSGVIFCYVSVIPAALKFLMGMQTEFLVPMISVTHYVDFLFGMLLAFGVAFNLPVFVIALAFAGVLNTQTLNHFHKHAIVLIFILSAILTPSPDIASQILLAVPLTVLFEVSVLGVLLVERRKKARALALSKADTA
jgi:sec-independent protein translocase protein TatC